MREQGSTGAIAGYSTRCYKEGKRRVFKTRTFARWSRKASVEDAILCKTVEEMVAGPIDADLGGHVYKQRIPLPGRGKRGRGRTILGSNLGDRWFFLFGFGKNERTTIEPRELGALQKVAATLLSLDLVGIALALDEMELVEICHEEKQVG
jgi:hypothetical protein